MPSTVPSTPASDTDMDVDMDTNSSTAVPSSPVLSVDDDLKHIKGTADSIMNDVSSATTCMPRVMFADDTHASTKPLGASTRVEEDKDAKQNEPVGKVVFLVTGLSIFCNRIFKSV